jgi:chromate transporter
MADAASAPSPGALFKGFLSIGICGFGGVLPWARRILVERRGWLTPAEFTDLLSLCQFLPGPNVINLSVALGARFHGPLGSLAAFSGLIAAPMAIVLGLAVAYARLGGLPVMQHAFAGLAAAASALVFATALKIAAPLRHKPWAVGVGLLTLAAITVLHASLPLVLLAAAPISILLAWRNRASVLRA